jgi:hypothetical protein
MKTIYKTCRSTSYIVADEFFNGVIKYGSKI